jgi:hypothetical protein
MKKLQRGQWVKTHRGIGIIVVRQDNFITGQAKYKVQTIGIHGPEINEYIESEIRIA